MCLVTIVLDETSVSAGPKLLPIVHCAQGDDEAKCTDCEDACLTLSLNKSCRIITLMNCIDLLHEKRWRKLGLSIALMPESRRKTERRCLSNLSKYHDSFHDVIQAKHITIDA